MGTRRLRAVVLLSALICLFPAWAVPVAGIDAGPTIVSPTPGSTVAADASLSWQPVSGAAGYRVQLSAGADFAFAYETIDTVATSVAPDLYFTPGTLHWRVATLDGTTPGPWTTASFQVARTDIPLPSAPADGTVYNYPGPGPVLDWTPSLAGPYEVELDGPWGVGAYVSDASRFAIPQALPVGTWTWRVRPLVHNEGMPWSPARTFVVEWPNSDPVIDAPVDGASAESFVMDWQPIPGAASYDVQVSPAADFPQCCRSELQTNVTTLDLGRNSQDETRWWRVRGRNGQILGPWSAGRSVTHAAWSEAPTDLWPPDGALAVAPTLRWSPLADASRYEIQVATDPLNLGAGGQTCRTFANAASFAVSPGGACATLASLSPGQVYWRVRGVDDPTGTTSAWSVVGEFNYDPPTGPALAAPVIATPLGPDDCSDAAVCDREMQMPLLRWAGVDQAKFYRVQLDQRDAHLPGTTWDTPGTTFLPPRDALTALGGARFSWQVIACESEATCPAWTEPSAALRHFAIGPRPLVLSPSNGTIANGEIDLGFAVRAVDPPAAGDPWHIVQSPARLWVQLDDESGFGSPNLFSAALDRQHLVFGALPTGQIHWRVSYGDPTDPAGTVSRSFTWNFASTVTEPTDGVELDTPARVGWTPALGAARYVVEVDRQGWHPPILNGEQQWTNALVGDDFIPGPLDWRVTPVDVSGHRGTPVGGTFDVAPKNPVLTTPLDGASVSAVGAALDWEAVDSTAGYRVDVSTTPDFTSLVDSAWTQRTRYIPTIQYPAGQLWWRIRAESGYGQILGEVIGTSAARQFTSVAVVVADLTPPVGTMAIAAGTTYTNSTAVTLTTAAADPVPGSGLSQVALSNDGTTWTTRSYAASQAWTLPATIGTHTVYAKWQDAAGNWSAVATDTIVLDTVAPSATAPRRGFVAGTSISSGKIALRVPWSGTDATSGIARYELAQSTDGGAWTTISTALTSPTTTRSLAPQHSYRFRVRAIDQAGNPGAWATGSTFRLARYSESSAAIRYSGAWTKASSASFWGGTARKSTAAGARASITFSGRSIAWVARTGPNRGRAAIYVNGTKVATVDLYSPTAGAQRVVWVGSWTTAASRTVSIRVAGTSSRPRVDLDALVTAN